MARRTLVREIKVLQERDVVQTYDPHKTTNEARQGNSRMMNSRVLWWSLGGIIVAFLLIYLVFFAFAPGPATVPAV
jgi:hypothetical protein